METTSKHSIPRQASAPALVGQSPRMRDLFAVLERVAQSDAPVLICGETGTGKELVAEYIHTASRRAEGPFVICDLSAVGPQLLESELFGHRRGAFTSAEHERQGAFAQAHGGTIFLDEVGDLDESAQPRLLRAIERREIKPVGGENYRAVDVRVLTATNRDLAAEARAGRFRPDLYHRLAVVCLDLPPLRERREDIPLLAAHILGELAAGLDIAPPSVSPEAMDLLCQYDWPGNIRELRNVLQRAVSLSPDEPVLDWEMLRVETERKRSGFIVTRSLAAFKEAKDQLLDEWESEYLKEVLERAGGNITLAAQYAGIARGHLYRLLKKHGLCR